MGWICGWINSPRVADAAHKVLTDMLGRVSGNALSSCRPADPGRNMRNRIQAWGRTGKRLPRGAASGCPRRPRPLGLSGPNKACRGTGCCCRRGGGISAPWRRLFAAHGGRVCCLHCGHGERQRSACNRPHGHPQPVLRKPARSASVRIDRRERRGPPLRRAHSESSGHLQLHVLPRGAESRHHL